MVNDARVLLISGDTGLIEDVRRITGGIGRIDVDVVASLDRAYGYAGWEQVTLVLIHHDGSGSFAEVGRFLRMMAAARRPSPTIVLADSCDRDRTAEVLRSGVADLLTYPFEMARMSYLIDTLTLRSRRPRVTIAANSDVEPASPVKSDPIAGFAIRVAPLAATILIQGEAGTGKSVLAAAIHDHSERRNGPFLTIRCSTLPPERLGDEFFGDVDLPYSDSPSHMVRVRGGTLVLDDVDMLSYQSQIALIRWIESRPAEEPGAADRPRLIATTRLSLADEVTLGRFRSDLFYRLNVIGLQLDPLRERGEEIGIAARSILEELAGPTVSLSADAIRAIEAHSWSGNFRELREVLESALSHRRGPVLERDVLPSLVRTAVSVPSSGFSLTDSPTRLSDATLAQTKCDAEFARITQALEKHGQNRLRTARELGISRMTLYKKLYKYGIIAPGGQAGPSSMRSPARAAKPILPTSEGSGGSRYR